jgi:hypothetical protein
MPQPPSGSPFAPDDTPRRTGVSTPVVVLIAALCLMAGGVVGLLVGIGVGVAMDVTSTLAASVSPQGIQLAVQCPAEVTVGQRFFVDVSVQNTLGHEQTLDSLDLYDSYLDGITLIGASPAASSRTSSSIGAAQFSFETLWYNRAIPAGGQVDIRLEMQAAKPGHWAGDLDVCINEPHIFTTHVLQTTVKPGP